MAQEEKKKLKRGPYLKWEGENLKAMMAAVGVVLDRGSKEEAYAEAQNVVPSIVIKRQNLDHFFAEENLKRESVGSEGLDKNDYL